MITQAVELSISIHATDLPFDALEVWRSKDTADGPYEPLTDAGAQAARIPYDAPYPPAVSQTGPRVNCIGATLQLCGERGLLPLITITGGDPHTYTQLATQIEAQALGAVLAYVVGSLLVIETNDVGGHARLVVTGGDLAGLVGLPLNTPSYGREAYMPLVAGQVDYTFTDQQGDSSYWYKWRLHNTLLNETSEFSLPFHPQPPRVVSTIIGYADLTDMDGSALAYRQVRLYARFNGQLSTTGSAVAGYNNISLTDTQGHVEFTLVRGLPITMAIAGTNLVRDLTVPTDPTLTRFNLLDPSLGSNDVFKVQVPDIPYAVRRSF